MNACSPASGAALSDSLLDITRQTVQLNGSALALDAARFRHAIAKRARNPRLSEDDLEALANAVREAGRPDEFPAQSQAEVVGAGAARAPSGRRGHLFVLPPLGEADR